MIPTTQSDVVNSFVRAFVRSFVRLFVCLLNSLRPKKCVVANALGIAMRQSYLVVSVGSGKSPTKVMIMILWLVSAASFAPPDDSVFDRKIKCVRTGAGFKPGDTVSAHYYVKLGGNEVFGCPPPLKSDSRQKAVVVRTSQRTLKVKFKRDGRIEKIPKGWAELNSSTKLQVRTTSKVKKPIGKVRDVDFRFGLGDRITCSWCKGYFRCGLVFARQNPSLRKVNCHR